LVDSGIGTLGTLRDSALQVLVGGEPLQEHLEIGAREAPVEGAGLGVEVTLEGDDPIRQLQKVGEIVGREHLALEDREDDLD
jgi:hypothetical protein